MEQEIVINQKKSKTVLYMVLAILICALCIWAVFLNFRDIHSPYRLLVSNIFIYVLLKIIIMVGVVFFGFTSAFLMIKLIQNKPIFIVNKLGVTDNGSALSMGFIPWQDISKAYIGDVMNSRFIELEIMEEEKYLNKANMLKRKVLNTNKKMGHQMVCIPMELTGLKPEEVLSQIKVYLEKFANKAS